MIFALPLIDVVNHGNATGLITDLDIAFEGTHLTSSQKSTEANVSKLYHPDFQHSQQFRGLSNIAKLG